MFTTLYIGYATVSVIAEQPWTSSVSKSLAVTALALGTLTCAEMLVLGLDISFLEDRIVPPGRRRVAYSVLAGTALAAFAVAGAGDSRFAAALGSLILPGAAAFGILVLFSSAYVARQQERARERGTRRAPPRATQRAGPKPASKQDRSRTQTAAKSRQRKGGRKRH